VEIIEKEKEEIQMGIDALAKDRAAMVSAREERRTTKEKRHRDRTQHQAHRRPLVPRATDPANPAPGIRPNGNCDTKLSNWSKRSVTTNPVSNVSTKASL